MKYIYSTLKINRRAKIVVGGRLPLPRIGIFYEVMILFDEKKHSLLIGRDICINIAEQFISLFTKAINNSLVLDDSCNNIGHIDNEYDSSVWIYRDEHRISIKKNDHGNWIGEQYRLCVYKERVSWLYNDQYGNIILEITPWFNVRKCKSKASYEKWIKNYKPILKRTIAQEVAQKWIQQMKVLLRMVRINSGLDSEYDFMTNKEI
jgi:hypothetical protein